MCKETPKPPKPHFPPLPPFPPPGLPPRHIMSDIATNKDKECLADWIAYFDNRASLGVIQAWRVSNDESARGLNYGFTEHCATRLWAAAGRAARQAGRAIKGCGSKKSLFRIKKNLFRIKTIIYLGSRNNLFCSSDGEEGRGGREGEKEGGREGRTEGRKEARKQESKEARKQRRKEGRSQERKTESKKK